MKAILLRKMKPMKAPLLVDSSEEVVIDELMADGRLTLMSSLVMDGSVWKYIWNK